MDKLTNRRENS